jgi:hypothetical protein
MLRFHMAKNKDDARAEGYERGLAGKGSASGILQGWTDDKDSGPARAEGYIKGKRKRAQVEATKKARAKR